jgi:hypothetical protein
VVDDVTDTKEKKLEDAVKKVRGQALRELQVFLDKNDPGRTYGRLEKVTIPKTGQVRWLCPDHAKPYVAQNEEAAKASSPEIAPPPTKSPPAAPPAKPTAANSNQKKVAFSAKQGPKPPAVKMPVDEKSPPTSPPAEDALCKLLVLSTPGTISSSVCVRFAQGILQEKYDPTKTGTHNKEIIFEGKKIRIEILDAQNIELFAEMRETIIKNSHGFIIATSLGSAESPQHSLSEIYFNIIKIKDTDKLPFLLVGLSDAGTTWERQVSDFASKHTLPYLEMNASSGTNVEDSFNTLIRQFSSPGQISQPPPKSSSGGFINKLTFRRK